MSTSRRLNPSSYKHADFSSPTAFKERGSSPLVSSNHFDTPPPFPWKSSLSTHGNHFETPLSTPSKQSIYTNDTITPNRLFGSRHEENSSSTGTLNRPRGLSSGLGYFAFPPTGQQISQQPAAEQTAVPEEQPSARPESQSEDKPKSEAERKENLKRKEAEEARRLQIEAEAKRGEEAWVRSGGVLRDARGKRDLQRTEAVRAELKLRDWEAKVSTRWKKYEESWRALLAEGGDDKRVAERMLAFGDIPWPVHVAEEGEGIEDGRKLKLEDLTSDRVEAFFLEPLKVRGCTVTKKERIRSALLRWHPDKMTGVLRRIVSEDVEDVRAGIRVVVECLQKLNTNA